MLVNSSAKTLFEVLANQLAWPIWSITIKKFNQQVIVGWSRIFVHTYRVKSVTELFVLVVPGAGICFLSVRLISKTGMAIDGRVKDNLL